MGKRDSYHDKRDFLVYHGKKKCLFILNAMIKLHFLVCHGKKKCLFILNAMI